MNPGIYHDLSDTAYHADEALSASGAKKLLPPSCPALYKYDRDHGQAPRREFDFGHAAHAKVLGVGAEVVVIDADSWRTKAAKEAGDAARAEGKTPLLAEEAARVDGMATALAAHPFAAALLDPDHGRPEVSAFWHDDRHDIDRRARFDWLPATDGGRMLLPDYKSTVCAEKGAFTRSAFTYGYHLQAVYYLDAIKAHGLAEDVAFLFVAQEKTAPYLVNVLEMDGDSLAIGRANVDQACAVFADCTANDTWPGYSDDVELISPPAWLARQYEGAPW